MNQSKFDVAEFMAEAEKLDDSTQYREFIGAYEQGGPRTMDNRVVSMRPQLLCGKLARKITDFLGGGGTTPEDILALCDETMQEIGAVRNEAGEWALPDDSAGEKS